MFAKFPKKIEKANWKAISFAVFSTLGFILQVFYISRAYFRYETTVDVAVDKSGTIVIPGLTICHDIPSDLYSKKMFASVLHYPWIVMRNLDYVLTRMPLDKVAKLVSTLSDLKLECSLICSHDPAFTSEGICADVDCSDLSPNRSTIIMSLKGNLRRCFTFFHRNSTQNPIYETNYGVAHDLIKLQVRSGTRHTLYVGLHSYRDLIHIEFIDHITISMGDILTATVAFQSIRVLLFYCRQYAEGHRNGCLQACMRRLMFERCGSWPLNIPSPMENRLPYLNDTYECTLDRYLMDVLSQNCHDDCTGLECETIYYTSMLKTVQLAPFLPTKSYETRIQIKRPFGYEVTYVSRPKMTLSEYLVYIGSCIGIWYGVSVVFILEKTLRTIGNFQKVSKRPKEKLKVIKNAEREYGNWARFHHERQQKVYPYRRYLY